jgi:hypothetical protein
MSTYDDDDLEFDFFDEPETVEATQRRRLPRLEMPGSRGNGGDGPPREPRSGPPTGLLPLARLVGLIAIAIFVVVVLVFWVGSCQGKSKHDEYASYAQQVQAITKADADLGTKFANALLSTTKQSDLETKLAQYAQQEQQELVQAQQIRPPGPLRQIHSHLLDAIELRARGLTELGDGLARVPATKTLSAAQAAATETSLANIGALLTASDVVWEQLYRLPATHELQQEGVTGVVIPKSVFVTNTDVVSGHSFAIVLQNISGASTGGTPSGLHGSALVGVHVSPQGSDLSTSSATTIKVSVDLAFVVSVQDSGDFPQSNVGVVLKIKAGSFSLTRTQTIASIQPKETATVTFKSFNLPAAAFANQVQITATVKPVPGEKKLDNNTATYPAFFTLS